MRLTNKYILEYSTLLAIKNTNETKTSFKISKDQFLLPIPNADKSRIRSGILYIVLTLGKAI
jgi:hypothetical protein